MKKMLTLLILILLLTTGCKKGTEEDITVHENIRDEIVQDSYTVMRTVERYVTTEEKENMDVLLDYEYKYKDDESLTVEEEQLIQFTGFLIDSTDNFTKDTDTPLNFKAYKEAWYDTAETGTINTVEDAMRTIK